ncbi:MAG TPA: hypothetical protein VME40_07445 [Caulobacteraceae bacterium]|nr:hypothetical protein [Caulobacteraceae bacterium]
MTTPHGEPAIDLANNLLSEQPARIFFAKIPAPLGERLAMTIRTTSATVTVLLSGKDAKTWAKLFTAQAEGMSETGLATGSGTAPK